MSENGEYTEVSNSDESEEVRSLDWAIGMVHVEPFQIEDSGDSEDSEDSEDSCDDLQHPKWFGR